MSQPQIRVMIDVEEFRHLVAGGELRVATEEGTACVCFSDLGFEAMSHVVDAVERYGDVRLGQVFERQPRS